MLTALGTWFLTKGAALLLGYGVQLAMDWKRQNDAEQSQRDAGRLEAERDQARVGEDAQGELADEAAKRVTEDDAISRLGKGDA